MQVLRHIICRHVWLTTGNPYQEERCVPILVSVQVLSQVLLVLLIALPFLAVLYVLYIVSLRHYAVYVQLASFLV